MVYFKRKPFAFEPAPTNYPRDADVWIMPKTDEVFTSYEKYLERYDYYCQKKFTCMITGHTNLSFWDAWKSETQGSKEVDSIFPDPLRGPVLRKVQFSTISRIDELVAWLYELFKENFVPGEQVTVIADNAREDGVVRDKATFPEDVAADGTVLRPAMIRYFVKMSGDREAVVDERHLVRGRRCFTKQVVRSFLKNSITRDRWDGAPWIVKEPLARQFNLPLEVPAKLQYDAVTAERKAQAAMKKQIPENGFAQFYINKNGELTTKEGANPSKSDIKKAQKYFQLTGGASGADHGALVHRAGPTNGEAQSKHPHHPTSRNPVEDLQVPSRREKEPRPRLKTFPIDQPFQTPEALEDGTVIHSLTVGPLLESWNTLNVFGDFFYLDGFTFDDFTEAMLIASNDIKCNLFSELHCAVLIRIVDESGTILSKSLSSLGHDDEDDEDDDDEEDADDDGEEDQLEDEKILPDATASQSKASSRATSRDPDASLQVNKIHRAGEMINRQQWVEKVQARDFNHGGWQLLMVGLLHRLSRKPLYKVTCDKILSHLAPLYDDATQEVAADQYATLDVNLRVTALQLATVLAVETKAFKEFMEECMKEQTETRKEKQSIQSKRRPLVTTRDQLDEQRKLLRPDETTESPELNAQIDDSTISRNGIETHEAHDSEQESEAYLQLLNENRRASGRAADLKRKRQEQITRKVNEKKAKLDDKEAEAYKKVLADLDKVKQEIADCEDEISQLDKDLRENACHRTKVIGKDRFLNNYYWFERNGMPFEGDPDSSTAYAYANGRLWIQGPDVIERQGILDLSSAEAKLYEQRFGETVPQRREREEGETMLADGQHWGFYDTAEDLDNLILWLDDRGEHEKLLKKELKTWREQIVECMDNMHARLATVAEKQAQKDERVIGIATRKKLQADYTAIRFPCTVWTNTKAIAQFNQPHIDGPPPKKIKRGERAIKESSAPPEKRTTRLGTKFGR